jgi:hypothetical protein
MLVRDFYQLAGLMAYGKSERRISSMFGRLPVGKNRQQGQTCYGEKTHLKRSEPGIGVNTKRLAI